MNQSCRTLAIVVAVVAGGAMATFAVEPTAANVSEPRATVRIERDQQKIERLRTGELGQHITRMADELRALTAAKFVGQPLPELTTNELQTVDLPGGMTRVRLGVAHLNTSVVRFAGQGEAVLACVNGAPDTSLAPVASGAEVTQ